MNPPCSAIRWNWLLLLGSCYACFLLGCTKTPSPPETVVTGTVTYQGKPVTGGSVIFDMEDPSSSRPYMGEIYDDGTYELTYVVPGKAKVAIVTDTKQGLPTYVEIPRKYTSPKKSGLEYEVITGPQTYNIVLD